MDDSATLIAETWPAEHRAKALGLMQSTWAIGEMLAVGVVALVLPHYGWRAVFFVGVLPAFAVFGSYARYPNPKCGVRVEKKGAVRCVCYGEKIFAVPD